MGKVILVCGKIGSGKTTYAKRLADELGAVIITQDEIMLGLFGSHFYDESPELYEKYCNWVEEYVKKKAGEIAKSGGVVICENGYWPRSERDELKLYYTNMGVACELHYIDTSDELRLKNIESRNLKIKNGEIDFYVTTVEQTNHYFEIPDDDEIDVRVRN